MTNIGFAECLAVVRGLATYVAPLDWYRKKRKTGRSTEDAVYCYTVWMRHLSTMQTFGWHPAGKKIGELGPGNSAGVGVAALLSGVDSYSAFGALRYPFSKNLTALVALVRAMARLYSERRPIPTPDEYPQVVPFLESYEFPSWLDQEQDLASHRKKVIEELTRPPESEAGFKRLQYIAPYASLDMCGYRESFDGVFSQAVFEHVREVEDTYRLVFDLLKPGGWSWHVIDFRSHGLSSDWNGHWGYPQWLWKIIEGRREFLLNRLPLSEQIKAAGRAGFKIEQVFRFAEGQSPALARKSRLRREDFAEPFSELSDEDKATLGAMVILRTPV